MSQERTANWDSIDKNMLVTDLSIRPPEVFGQYVDLYLQQVKRPNFWDKKHLDEWALEVAGFVATADKGISSALRAIGMIIGVAKAELVDGDELLLLDERQTEDDERRAGSSCRILRNYWKFYLEET